MPDDVPEAKKCAECGRKLSQDEMFEGYCSDCGAAIALLWDEAGVGLWGGMR